MVSDYLSNTLQRYKINSILPNISALFFKFFLKYFPANNNPSLLRNNMLLLVNKDVLTCPVTEIHEAKPAATYFEGKKVFSM